MTKEKLVDFYEKVLNMVINLNVSEKNLLYVAETILLELGFERNDTVALSGNKIRIWEREEGSATEKEIIDAWK